MEVEFALEWATSTFEKGKPCHRSSFRSYLYRSSVFLLEVLGEALC